MTWIDVIEDWAEADEDKPLDFGGEPVPERFQRLLELAFVNSAPTPEEPDAIHG